MKYVKGIVRFVAELSRALVKLAVMPLAPVFWKIDDGLTAHKKKMAKSPKQF